MLMSEKSGLIYFVIVKFLRLIGGLPRHWAFRIGRALGHIVMLLDKKHQKIAEGNLTNAFGGEKTCTEIRLLARQVFENLGTFWNLLK